MNVCKYLMRVCRDWAKLFSLMFSGRKRGNGHKLKYRILNLVINIRKKNILLRPSQRDYIVFLRDIKNLASSGPEELVLSKRVGQGTLQSYLPSFNCSQIP